MKKINLRGISETLNDSEMKGVKGGAVPPLGGVIYDKQILPDDAPGPDGGGMDYDTDYQKKCDKIRPCADSCLGKKCGEWCDGDTGICKPFPNINGICLNCYH